MKNNMSMVKVFENKEFGTVRTIEDGDKVLFCGSDVAKALGYTNPNKAINDHCRAITKRYTPISGKTQAINFIPEGDVYRLIVRSKLPEAEKFEKWFMEEVLPTIRKTGGDLLAISNPPEVAKQIFPSPSISNRTNNPQTICGVECYEEDGTAYLKLETVARGLGFTRVAASGNEVVRWERVDGYLAELNFVPTCGHESFIPENIFYRLAMKAKNEVAEKFQALVADEIIPSIRKHGMYATPITLDTMIADPDFAIGLLTNLKEERAARLKAEQERAKVEAQNQIMLPKADYFDKLVDAGANLGIRQFAKELKVSERKLVKFMLDNKYLFRDKKGKLLPYAEYTGTLFEVKEFVADNGYTNVKTLFTPAGRDYFLKLGIADKLKEAC